MAYVIVTEGLHDQAYPRPARAGLRRGAPAAGRARARLVPRRTCSARRRRAARRRSGRPPSPACPAETILRALAIEYATTQAGRAAVRLRARAHDPRRAVPPRGLRALRDDRQRRHRRAATRAPATAPPAAAASRACRPAPNPAGARVATPLLADLLERGKAGGYPADIKMIYSVARRSLQPGAPTSTKIVAAAERLEFMVVHDHFVTPTARYADIVLPATTFWERNDVHTPWAGAGHYAIFMQQAIAPMGECRNDIDICADLAGRLGIEGYNDKTEDEWLRELTKRRHRRLRHLPRAGAWPACPRPRTRSPSPGRSATPSATRSRRRRARSRSTRWPRGQPRPLRPRGDPADPDLDSRSRGRPRIRCGWSRPKSRARTHSIHDNQPVLSRADRDDVWMQPGGRRRARHRRRPARARVQRARRTVLPARVTDRIAPGVRLHQGRRLVHARRARPRHARLRQRPHRRPRLPGRRRRVQQHLRRNRARVAAPAAVHKPSHSISRSRSATAPPGRAARGAWGALSRPPI